MQENSRPRLKSDKVAFEDSDSLLCKVLFLKGEDKLRLKMLLVSEFICENISLVNHDAHTHPCFQAYLENNPRYLLLLYSLTFQVPANVRGNKPTAGVDTSHTGTSGSSTNDANR